MKKVFEWIGGFALIVFSFYFTDKVSMLVADKSDLMQEIKSVSASYEEEPTEAQIDQRRNTIVPGKFGKKVDSRESYINMHDFGSFNENYLVYEYIKPSISLEDNKDKYIISGNSIKRNVSIVLESNSELVSFLENEKIKYNYIVTGTGYSSNFGEKINGGSTESDFKKIDKEISNSKKSICIKQYSNEKLCRDKNYFIIYPNIVVDNSNISQIKNEIKPGGIILVSNTCKLENLKYILSELEYKDLEVVHISELIDERA